MHTASESSHGKKKKKSEPLNYPRIAVDMSLIIRLLLSLFFGKQPRSPSETHRENSNKTLAAVVSRNCALS
jgi:hypothetical protein